MESDIAYARSGGVAIAYQVMGGGDVDLVYVPDYTSNLVFAMRYPRWRHFYESLATRFRLILFDKRGTGLSDHGGQFATLETRMEDMHAVLDAVGSVRTVVLASHEGCGMAALYAASYPGTDDGTCPVPPERGGRCQAGSHGGDGGAGRFA